MSTVGSYRGPNIVTRGLVLHLDAASPNSYYSPNGGTVWKDVSGNDNDGTLVNGTTFSDDAFDFDGVDDYVEIANPYSLAGGTAEVWCQRLGSGTRSCTVMGSYGGSSKRSPTFYGDTTINWEFGNDIGNNTGVAFTLNEWFHLVLTYDNSFNIAIYSNGTQISTGSSTNPGGFWTSEYIGNYGNYQDANFEGNIASFKAYNRALSAQEVLQNYNATKDRFGL